MPKNKLLRNEKLYTITIERVEKFISKDYWTDVNLYSKLYKRRTGDTIHISVFSVPDSGDPNTTDRVSYSEAIKNTFVPTKVGTSYGPSWSTHWFNVSVEIPADYAGEEVHLCWDNGSEALIYHNGVPVQSLYGGGGNDRRSEYLLTKKAKGGEKFEFYIEMACNGMFGNPADGNFLNPPTPNKTFTLSMADVAVLNREAWDLYWCFDVILGIAKELPEESNRRCKAIHVLEQMVNICFPDDQSTFSEALKIAATFLGQKNGQSQHLVTALGHCHIDTAWLWCYSETRRKCARSWSTQLTLMEQFPKYRFTASQAQQFEWVLQNYPVLFKQMQAYAKNDRFIPSGGTWVEMDCNIPSGEAFVRQFLYGQRFFEREFGVKSTEFWLPDTFGYSAQLPQIIRGSGMEFFLTQKLSWNLINKFPHNSFTWVGIDGSEVLCHFPPADTYCGNCSVSELVNTVKNNKNKDSSNHSMYLFGIGDGGGGPTLQMLERLNRLEDVDGLPKIEYQTPHQFFQKLKSDGNSPKWIGELYFELHSGTYTTHAQVKKENRLCEFLLRNVEFFSAAALTKLGKNFIYPKKELDRLWKLVLLNQFHDVLPGTSIGPAYNDTHKHHADVLKTGSVHLKDTLEVLTKAYASPGQSTSPEVVVFNSLSWPRSAVVELPQGVGHSGWDHVQKGANGNLLAVASAPSMGWSTVTAPTADLPQVKATKTPDGHVVLENAHIRASFDKNGYLVSLIHLPTQREALEIKLGSTEGIGKGNQFALFDDLPFYWDAWDVFIYHKDKRRNIAPTPSSLTIVESGPLRAAISLTYTISQQSHIKQTIYLDCIGESLVFDTHVTWHENRKFLKVEFPLNVRNEVATYSIQYGNLQRPTHTNTSWDMAKFEVCGHHWADLSEYGFGVAVLSSSKYGWACDTNVLRLSLLRSPKMPDNTADMGEHHFTYALFPHRGTHAEANLPRHGYNFNQPLLTHSASHSVVPTSLFTVHNENLILECLKRSEGPLKNDLEDHGTNELVVRLWETLGGRGVGRLTSPLTVKAVTRCNLLEEDVASETYQWNEGGIKFSFKPFEIITFKLHF